MKKAQGSVVVRVVGVVSLGVAGGLPAAAQEFKPELLTKVKSAAAFIKTARGTGSGYLFRKSGSAAYLISCAHVVGNFAEVEAVFASGSKAEKSYAAQVVASDPDRDLACLVIRNAKDLPAPLELGTRTEVRETENVFVAGFPFGEMLSASRRNPEISLSRASVSSIRKDDYGMVVVVQLSGDVNPGNSGGPVIDAKGRVIGVAQSKIILSQTAFAVSSEEIRGFLKGRIKSLTLATRETGMAAAKVEAVAELVDPLGTLKSAAVAWMRQSDLKEDPKPEKDGLWGKAHASMKEVALKIKDDASGASGTFDIPKTAGDGATVRLVVQSRYTQADGTTHWTAPGLANVNLAAAGAATAGGAAKPAAEAAAPAPEVVPAKPLPKGVELKTADELTRVAVLPLRSAIADLWLHGDFLYALDLSEGRVLKLEAATLRLLAETAVADNAVALALAEDGATLYVAVASIPAARHLERRAGLGTIQIIPTRDMKVSSAFALDVVPVDLEAGNPGTLLLSVAGEGKGLVFVDPARGAVTDVVPSVWAGSFLRLHPDGTRVYAGGVGYPRSTCCVALGQKDPQQGYRARSPSRHGELPLGGDFEIAPDGRYLVTATGAVLRLSPEEKSDLHFTAKVEPFTACAVAPGSSTFFTATAAGFIKEYSFDTLELKKSLKSNRVCSRLLLDPKRLRLIAVSHPMPSGPPPRTPEPEWGRKLAVGDIEVFSLGGGK